MAVSGAKWMDQSFYESMPNSEVNWAQLAQNWMAMRDVEGEAADTPLPPPPPPTTKGALLKPPPPPVVDPNFIAQAPPFFPPMPVDGAVFPPPPGGPPPGWMPPPPPPDAGFGTPPIGGGAFPPFVPPLPPWPPEGMNATQQPFPQLGTQTTRKRQDEEEGGEYSHYYKEWDERQRDEISRRDEGGHGEADHHRVMEGERDEGQDVPQGAMAHWMGNGHHQWNGQQPPWYRPGMQTTGGMVYPFIDQQARKALPEWIREGLEKAEREKQKKVIKEQKLKAAEDNRNARREAKGLGKFDSDSSEDESSNEKGNKTPLKDGDPVFLKLKKSKQEEMTDKSEDDSNLEDVDYRTEEEKRDDALSLLRRFMTEILLMTTDNTVHRIGEKQIKELKRKAAQPKILAQSSALAALSSLGAESDSDDSDDAQRSDAAHPRARRGHSSGDETDDEAMGTHDERRRDGGASQSIANSKAKLSSSRDDGTTSPPTQHSADKGGGEVSEQDGAETLLKDGAGPGDGRHVENEVHKTMTAVVSKAQTDEKVVKKQGEDASSRDERRSSKSKRKKSSKEKKKDRSTGPERRKSRSGSREKTRKRRNRSKSAERKKRSKRRSKSSSTSTKSASSDESAEGSSRTPERYRRRLPNEKESSSKKSHRHQVSTPHSHARSPKSRRRNDKKRSRTRSRSRSPRHSRNKKDSRARRRSRSRSQPPRRSRRT